MTFKKCKNDGCEIQIEVRNTAEGWRPFEENGNKHNCQFSDYAKKQRAEQKNDHGNESYSSEVVKKVEELNQHIGAYVDHTAKGQSKVKIFYAPGTEVLEEQYNSFLKIKNGQIRTQGAQFQIRDSGFAIALYYEEVQK